MTVTANGCLWGFASQPWNVT